MLVYYMITGLLLPTMLVGFGAIFRSHPPKNINMAFGYRTSRSMKSRGIPCFAAHPGTPVYAAVQEISDRVQNHIPPPRSAENPDPWPSPPTGSPSRGFGGGFLLRLMNFIFDSTSGFVSLYLVLGISYYYSDEFAAGNPGNFYFHLLTQLVSFIGPFTDQLIGFFRIIVIIVFQRSNVDHPLHRVRQLHI